MKLEYSLISCTIKKKKPSKWMNDLNVRSETIKLLGKKKAKHTLT